MFSKAENTIWSEDKRINTQERVKPKKSKSFSKFASAAWLCRAAKRDNHKMHLFHHIFIDNPVHQKMTSIPDTFSGKVNHARERPIICMDLQIRTTFGFSWVGFGKPGVQIFSEEKYVHPEILFLFTISLKLFFFHFLISYFLMHCSEI